MMKEIMKKNDDNAVILLKNANLKLADYEDYIVHIVCLNGWGKFSLNNQHHTMSKNNFVIWLSPNSVSDLSFSADFEAEILLTSKAVIDRNTPDVTWSISANLYAREHFLLPLTPNEIERCLFNFNHLHNIFSNKSHYFYQEILDLQTQIFRLEMWDLFSVGIARKKETIHGDTIFERFMHLLQEHSLTQREVRFYAEKLHITPKYLSEICKQNSPKNASEWIADFTKQQLINLLRNKKLSFLDISEIMHFSSQSFFSRYVKKVLDTSPSQFRSRLAKGNV